jgi:hypothetical protein
MDGLDRDRETIKRVLTAAGWQPTDRARFGTAQYRHDNGKVTLEVTEGMNKNKNRFVDLELNPTFTTGLYLHIYFGEDDAKLRAVLDAITAFQDTIGPENFKQHLRALLKLCPTIDIDLDDRAVPLVDDETLGISS